MQLTVNDNNYEIAEGAHLDALLAELDLTECRGVAVAVNAVVVPAANWRQHVLHNGDAVLVIQAAQGG